MIDDDEDGEDDDPEDPADEDKLDEPAEVPCPYCGRPIADDEERCRHCGSYISLEDAPYVRSHPWWWVAIVVLLIAVILLLWRW